MDFNLELENLLLLSLAKLYLIVKTFFLIHRQGNGWYQWVHVHALFPRMNLCLSFVKLQIINSFKALEWTNPTPITPPQS